MSNILNHKSAIQIIRKFEKVNFGVLSKSNSPLDKIKLKIKPGRKEFDISFNYNAFKSKSSKVDAGKHYRKIRFTFKETHLIFESLYIAVSSFSKMAGSVGFFHTVNYSKLHKYYYRLIIPIGKALDFNSMLEQHVYTSDLGYRSRRGTKATINDEELVVNVIHDDKNRFYLSIESTKKQSYKSFSDKAFAIKNALGYITGYLAGDKGYFFSYDQRQMETPLHFYFCSFRSTVNSSYTPLHTNPFAWLHASKRLARRYYKKEMLRTLSTIEFSNLCQKLHDSAEFSSAILLLLESSIASLLFMPGGFAIVLESMSDIIMANDKEKLKPIKDKKVSLQVRNECLDIINKYCGSLPTEDLKALTGRIDQINQVTNKSRLRAPFKKLGIELLTEDVRVLGSRNDFLHGRIPDFSLAGTFRTDAKKNRDMYYAAMRFYTLLNMLILKWCGFDNYVLNHPKLQESFCKIKLVEEPYRKV